MTMNAKSKEPQFIVVGSTGVTPGNIVKTKIGSSQQSAPMLTARPQRPSDHGRGGSGSLRRRFMTRQVMQVRYEPSRLAQLRESMAFKATLEPMLIRDSKLVVTREMRTALTGMFHRGCT